ncbi:MAG: hypothetical protein ACYTE3_03065 [Planctomycetota bacterium]
MLVVLVLCLLGADPFVDPERHGRYEIETNEGYAFVLDSATGQVWSTLAVSGAGFTAWIDPNSPFSLPKSFAEEGVIAQ